MSIPWKALETAPKTGRAILLIDGDTECPVVARWVGNCWRVCWDNEIYHLSNIGGRGCHWMEIPDRSKPVEDGRAWRCPVSAEEAKYLNDHGWEHVGDGIWKEPVAP